MQALMCGPVVTGHSALAGASRIVDSLGMTRPEG
jgi:hypothetical protein